MRQQFPHLRGVDLRSGALEGRRGNAARRAYPERERQPGRRLGQRRDPADAEDIGDLVRVGRDRRRAMGEDRPDEFVHPELRRFEVHVSVDEPGRQGGACYIDHRAGLARSPAGHDPVHDREVGVDPLPGAGHEHPAAGEQQVSGLVAAGDGQHVGRAPAWRHGHLRELGRSTGGRVWSTRPGRPVLAGPGWSNRSWLGRVYDRGLAGGTGPERPPSARHGVMMPV